ncbi:MAG: FecR domain-containing protein [Desulfotalea sp.]
MQKLIFILCTAFVLSSFGSYSICAETLVPIEIQKGTNLIHLARDYCTSRTDWKVIAKINNLKPPYTILNRRTIMVPKSLLLTENLSGVVGSIHGDVSYLVDGKKVGDVQKNDKIIHGQTLSTGQDSYAQIVFPNHKYTRISPNSEFTINYLFRLTDDSVKADFMLKKGKLTHQITEKLRRNETFLTRTPVSITGVRGTEFRLKMIDDKTNYVETIKGKVKVESGARSVMVRKGQGASVKADSKIARPRPLPETPALPELQSVYRTLPISFYAPKHKNAREIRMRMCTDILGHDTFLEMTVPPGEKFIIPRLADGTYYTFFTALDRDLFESAPSKPFSVKVRTIPAAPMISSPRNGAIIFENKMTVDWLKSTQVKSYRIELATDEDFSNIIEKIESADVGYTTPELSLGAYYVRIIAVAEDGFETLSSVPVSWKISDEPKLGDVNTTEDGVTSFQWAPMKEKGTYDLQIARDENFKKIVASETGLTTSSYEVKDGLSSGTRYYVRVRIVLEGSLVSQWTPPQSLIIPCSCN